MGQVFIPHIDRGQGNSNDRGNNSASEGLFLRTARIVRVDYETMCVDIMYLDSNGAEPNLPLTSAYGGYRAFLGSMPMEGDWVLIGYSKTGGFKTPFIVSYLPRGYVQGLRNDLVGVSPTSFKQGIRKPFRFKMRKLYEGEIYGASQYGSELLLDKDVTLSSSNLVELFLNSADQSMSRSAISNYTNSAGVRVSSGLAYRNRLLEDPAFFRNDGSTKFPYYTSADGAKRYAPVFSNTINTEFPYGKENIDDHKDAFIEHRIDVKEMESPLIPVTEQNSGFDTDAIYSRKPDGDSNKPLVSQVMGTLIGNDPIGASEKYGVILKPKLFKSINDTKGFLVEEPCVVDDGINETITLAAAYALKFPNSGTAFYVNKEGKYIANIARSTAADPMGSGESLELNLSGHARISAGKNNSQGRSVTLNTAGGVATNWGYDSVKSRSWDATFRKGVSWNIVGADSDGVSLLQTIEGDVRTIIEGSRFTEIRGDDVCLVHGVLEDRVLGKKVDNFVNDKATNYGGAYNETAIGHYNQTLSSGKSVTIQGPDLASGSAVAEETVVNLGDTIHTNRLGNVENGVFVGNMVDKVLVGNREINVGMGNYAVSLSAGNIDIKTSAGSINVKTVAGNVTIQGTLGVTIKSAVEVKVEAPMVKLGNSPVQGGIVNDGPSGHKCYITGGPHLGSKTVTCNNL